MKKETGLTTLLNNISIYPDDEGPHITLLKQFYIDNGDWSAGIRLPRTPTPDVTAKVILQTLNDIKDSMEKIGRDFHGHRLPDKPEPKDDLEYLKAGMAVGRAMRDFL